MFITFFPFFQSLIHTQNKSQINRKMRSEKVKISSFN